MAMVGKLGIDSSQKEGRKEGALENWAFPRGKEGRRKKGNIIGSV
jgi:hypothetical protein